MHTMIVATVLSLGLFFLSFFFCALLFRSYVFFIGKVSNAGILDILTLHFLNVLRCYVPSFQVPVIHLYGNITRPDKGERY